MSSSVPESHSRPVEYLTTDLANARRLAVRSGGELRWVPQWRTWLTWDGSRWRVDDTGEAQRLTQDMAEELWSDVSRYTRAHQAPDLKTWIKHCYWSSSRSGIEATLAVAATLPGMQLKPKSLDADPWLLNVSNGTLDLRTGQLLKPDPANLMTKTTAVPFDPEAECPVWEHMLATSVGDPAVITFLQRAVGYSITGLTVEEVLLFLWGPGRNGKSKFVGALIELMLDYAAVAPQDLLTAGPGDSHPQKLADLHGRRLVVTSEGTEGRMNTGLMKLLTGGDELVARRMRENQWRFRPTHCLWLVANAEPEVRDNSPAVWERIRKVPFSRTIPASDRDKHLAEKLRAEYPGILAWAVRGCLDWQANGLGAPDAIVAATGAMRDDADWLGDFLSECTRQTEGVWVYTSDLYGAFRSWANECGMRELPSQAGFTRDLRARGLNYAEKIGVKRRGGFVGVDIAPPG